MNKKNNRKGFTTVELIIVIAVIAILATVLIPTFSGLIGKADESAALQSANNIFKSYFIGTATDVNAPKNFVIEVEQNGTTYYFTVNNGELVKTPSKTAPTSGIIVSGTTTDPYYATEPVVAHQHTDANHDSLCDTCGETV